MLGFLKSKMKCPDLMELDKQGVTAFTQVTFENGIPKSIIDWSKDLNGAWFQLAGGNFTREKRSKKYVCESRYFNEQEYSELGKLNTGHYCDYVMDNKLLYDARFYDRAKKEHWSMKYYAFHF